MAYLTHAEVLTAMGESAVLTFFDDDNDGMPDEVALESVIEQASALTDAWISPVYAGPFPISQAPVPAMVRQLTLTYIKALAYERKPGYTRAVAEAGANAEAYWARADEMGERLQKAVLRITELPSPKTTTTVVRAGGAAVPAGDTTRVFDCMGSFNTEQ
jgi:hypothetical protein